MASFNGLRILALVVLLLALIVLNPQHAKAQMPFIFESTIVVSPSTENLVVSLTNPPPGSDKKLDFGWKVAYNYGGEFKYYLAPLTSVSLGVMVQDKGFRNLLTFSTTDSTEGNAALTKPALIGSAKYLSFPLDLNLHFKTGRKSRFLLSGGVIYGRMLSQNLLGKRIPPELENTQTSVFVVEKGKSNVQIFNKSYFGINFGLGYTKYIKDKMVLTIQPHYIWQRNNALDENAPVVGGDRIRFNSFMVDVRWGYYFNSQIRNRGKDF